MSLMGADLQPHYGVDPLTNRIDVWPSSGNDPYEAQVKHWCEAAYEEAKHENASSEEVKEVTKFVDYLMGKQWPSGRPQYKSKPIDNRIWRLFWELVALLTDVRPMFEIKSLRKDYDAQAGIINNCTRSWWLDADADMTLTLITIYGLLCTGYAKLEWNPRLRNGEGDFNMVALGPNDVLPLKARNTLESAQALIYQAPMPVRWFRQKFPTRGYLVKPDAGYSRMQSGPSAPTHIPGMLFDLLSPQMKRVVGSPAIHATTVFPMALYREWWFDDFTYNTSNRPVYMGDPRSNWGYWVPPGKPLYPRGRLIIFGGSEVMHDGPNPYWHGKPPFAALRLNVVPWNFHGASELRALLPLQDIVNNILAGVLDMVKKAVNPNFIAPKSAFSDAVWNSLDWSMPGAKAQYSPISPHLPQFSPPPVLPGFVMNVMQLAAREMDTSSGIASVAEAVRKKQVPSASTLEEIKQSQQTPIRLKGRNMEIFLRRLGQMNISNIFQFYTAERRLFMLGTAGLTPEDYDFDPKTMVPAGVRPEDHIRNFVFMIHPGTLLNINQDQKIKMLMGLRQTKDLSRKTLFQQLDMGLDPDVEASNLKEENMAALSQAMQAHQITQAAGFQPQGGPGGQ